MKAINTTQIPDPTKKIRQEIELCVGNGNGFYTICRKEMGNYRRQLSPARKQIEDLGKAMTLIGNKPAEQNTSSFPLENRHLSRLYQQIKRLGEYRISKRDFRNMAQHCNAWPAYLAGKSFDLTSYDLAQAQEIGRSADECRHHLFNLFIARGMSPQAAKAIILQMNV